MKKAIKQIVSGAICVFMLASLASPITAEELVEPSYYHSENQGQSLIKNAEDIVITSDNLVSQNDKVSLVDSGKSEGYGKQALKLDAHSQVTFQVDVKDGGVYALNLDYFIAEEAMNNLILSVKINDQYQFYDSRNIVLQSIWKDASDTYKKDEAGNDMYPQPVMVKAWQSKDLNSTIYNFADPYAFVFQPGVNTITIETNDVPILLGDITLTGEKEISTYEEYRSQHEGEDAKMSEPLTLEAEKYTWKNESYIRGNKNTDQNCNPYDPQKKLINILSGEMWAVPNEGVAYEFEVAESGNYHISFKYRQSEKEDSPVFKQILIDGEYPFEELQAYSFPYSGKKMVNHTISVDGEAADIYLEAGTHTLTMISTAEVVYESYENLLAVNDKLNDIALDIKVITGNKVDKNRDWQIEEYLPNLKSDLITCAETIEKEYKKLSDLSGKDNVASISNLKVAAERLRTFSEDFDFLVNNMDQLTQGSSSVSEYVALVLPDLLEQPMSIDQIYIHTGDTDELGNPNMGFFASMGEEIKKLALSFTTTNDGSTDIEEGALNVWANRPVTHLDVMKEMVVEFEEDSGKKVNLSMMPDEQKLLLSVSANCAPDAVLGSSNYRPFDFALRGAIYDLRQFDDFSEAIQSFPSEMLIPFIIGDSCYALPETANFQVLFYRKDTLDRLGLEVPDTWDDVIEMLPTLSRYGMDFNTLIANVGGTKHFGTTIPFIQQYEGKVYSEDGTKVEFGDPKTVEAFTLMTDLYTKYSLPETISNFYDSFKKNVVPIGISDINTYVLLKNAAPEIAGQWGIAPSVGVEVNGKINRYQPSVATSCMIMKDASDPDGAWDLLKWWMSDDVQVEYSNQLRLRYGPEFIWNTANVNAFSKSSAFTEEDKEVIMEQLEYTMEIPRNPAYFSVERELSNAWNSVVFDGVSPRTALDQAITKSNRVINKKLKEFGYIDESGNLIKEFTMATAETVDNWKNQKD